MDTRTKGLFWLKKYFPKEAANLTRTSKFYHERELWFFTFPAEFFVKDDNEILNILCEKELTKDDFYFLKVPISFIKQNKTNFDIRKSKDYFDLHISAKGSEKFIELRSNGKVDFSKFVLPSL